jgi:hypothetical protein
MIETVDAFATQRLSNDRYLVNPLEARRNPFRRIQNLFRKPKVTANFPVDGKKVKISAEKTEELSQKYKSIDDVGERAYQVVMDLELVDTKWRSFDNRKQR